jgi:hypothetical protein
MIVNVKYSQREMGDNEFRKFWIKKIQNMNIFKISNNFAQYTLKEETKTERRIT